jgi:hypothetical protein
MNRAKNLLKKLNEMATLGRYKGVSFHVYHEPLKNPSFHLNIGDELNLAVQIKDFKVLEIIKSSKKYPYKKGDYLKGELAKVVKEFFDKEHDKLSGKTNLEVFHTFWDGLN